MNCNRESPVRQLRGNLTETDPEIPTHCLSLWVNIYRVVHHLKKLRDFIVPMQKMFLHHSALTDHLRLRENLSLLNATDVIQTETTQMLSSPETAGSSVGEVT